MGQSSDRIRALLASPAGDHCGHQELPGIAGKTVLVTGAGGSIGAELCRQTGLAFPERVILLGRGENSIYQIAQELRRAHPALPVRAVIGDVRDPTKMKDIFARERPQLVFHTAAYKHVSLVEEFPEEGVRNNVFGTLCVVETAVQAGVETVSLVSTDKAVEPTSVYGCTKKLAEAIMRSAAQTAASRLVTVRFGNVLRSRGSVIPLFEQQIADGGPVTVNHPEMRRFFKSIPEAAHLVLESLGLASSGDLCVLDMGEPVRILDLAEILIEMHGKRPYKDIEIVFTGAQPGEKLEEALLTLAEAQHVRCEGKIMVTPSQLDGTCVDRASLVALREVAERCDREGVLAQLAKMIEGYVPARPTAPRTRTTATLHHP